MMMSSDPCSKSGPLPSKCITNTPDSRIMSWVMLYFVRAIVTRGASGTIAAAPAESEINPFTLPCETVVTATGNGRKPESV